MSYSHTQNSVISVNLNELFIGHWRFSKQSKWTISKAGTCLHLQLAAAHSSSLNKFARIKMSKKVVTQKISLCLNELLISSTSKNQRELHFMSTEGLCYRSDSRQQLLQSAWLNWYNKLSHTYFAKCILSWPSLDDLRSAVHGLSLPIFNFTQFCEAIEVGGGVTGQMSLSGLHGKEPM